MGDILGKLRTDVVLPSSNRVYGVMQIEGAKIRDFVLADVLPKLQWPSLEFVQSVWQCYEENGGEEESKKAMNEASSASFWNKYHNQEPKNESDLPAVKVYYAYNTLEYFMGTFGIVRKRLLEGTWNEPSVGLIVSDKSGNIAGSVLAPDGLLQCFERSKELPHALDYWEPHWARLRPGIDNRDDGYSWFRDHEKIEMALYKAFNCTITIGLDKFRADMETIANHMASQAQVKLIPAT